MFRKSYLQLAGCMLIVFSAVTGCSQSGSPDKSTATASATDTSEPPVARLGNAVVPIQYQLELRIDPSQERFSGNVAIDVTVNESLDAIWLHGKLLDVSEVYVTDGESNRIDASYEERDESGVALLTLARTISAGPATLRFTYDAAFNTKTNGLFQVVRGEDHYAASQMEAIAARLVFPGFDEPGFKVPFDLSIIARADDVVITTTPEASVETLDDGFVNKKLRNS